MIMPNLREHIRHDSEFFKVPKGAFRWVHEIMDYPQKFYGKDHRRFYHTPQTCEFLALLDRSGIWVNYNGINMPIAKAICLEHIRLDIESTKRKNAIARERYRKKKSLNKRKNKS